MLSRESSPLRMAIMNNQTDTIRALLDAKANPNEVYHGSGISSPLCEAVFKNHPESVRLLLAAKADPNKQNARSASSPIWYVRTATVLEILIEAKADPFVVSHGGMTLMHKMAETMQSTELPMHRRFIQPTEPPMHVLMYKMAEAGMYRGPIQPIEIMQVLLDHKASVSVKDKLGKTPLHYAAAARCNENIKFLLERQANIFEKTNDGKNVIRVAKEARPPSIRWSGDVPLLETTVTILKTEMMRMRRMQSVAIFEGLHHRAGVRSVFAKAAARSTHFEQKTLKLVLKLAGAKTAEQVNRTKRKR